MDDKHSALLWQLMQNLNTQEDHNIAQEPQSFEQLLLSLKPLMSPKQQMIIDLVVKMNEVKAILWELNEDAL